MPLAAACNEAFKASARWGNAPENETYVVATQVFFWFVTPKIGEDFQFDEHIFQMGGLTTNQIWYLRG